MRRLVQLAVIGAALLLAARTWLVEGIVAPLVVSGGSMAPALLGAHRRIACHDCCCTFACGAESLPASGPAVCPNCGAENDVQASPARAGDRLFVDRAAYALGRPGRWDRVVLSDPDDAARLCVKRVAGLPGEAVELRDGDLYINGRMARRDWRQLLAMAIVVHDSGFRSQSGRGSRWRAKRATTGWQPVASGYGCTPPADETAAAAQPRQTGLDEPDRAGFVSQPDIDWLVFEYQSPAIRGPSAERPAPILDDLAYNQHESRELMAVPDVLLQCRLEPLQAGRLWLEANDGRRQFFLRLDVPSGDGQLMEGRRQLATFSAGPLPPGPAMDLVFALADAQLRLVLGGRTVIDHSYDPLGIRRQPTARPLAIGSAGLAARLSDLRVLRDVYYLDASRLAGEPLPQAGRPNAGGPLPEGQYWLLGDQSAASTDSRHWSWVDAKLFLGKVLFPGSP